MGRGMVRALNGALEGVNEGLDWRERKLRYDRDDERRDLRETRQGETSARQAEAHELNMKRGNMQIDDLEAEQERKSYERKLDDATHQFIITDGNDFEALQTVVGQNHPGAEKPQITKNGDKFDIDFGNGNIKEGLTKEQIVGLAVMSKDPDVYYKDYQAKQQRAAEKEEGLAKEKRDHGRSKELKRIDHNYRMAERKPDKPSYQTGADGQLYAIEGANAQPVQGPEGGLSVRPKAKPTGDVALMEYMVDNGIAANEREAYNMAKQAKSNPTATAAKLAENEFKAQAENFIRPGDEAHQSLEQLYEKWMQTLSGGNQPQGLNTPEDIKAAYKRGELSREEAKAEISRLTGG